MRVSISPEWRTAIRAQDEERCAYCRSPEALTVTTFEIDHIIPHGEGGETQLTNLCLACPACNRHKATRQLVLDPDSLQEVSIFQPRRDAWDEHFEWVRETWELRGKTPTGRATLTALQLNRPALVRLRGLWAKMNLFP